MLTNKNIGSANRMNSICLQKKCIACCKNTNMHLTKKDIAMILKAGYHLSYFSCETNGWMQLKNHQGRCVFHDGKTCQIYPIRPQGCRLYPVVYNISNNSIFYDEDCPYFNFFSMTKKQQKIMNHLISQLISERKKRLLCNNTQD